MYSRAAHLINERRCISTVKCCFKGVVTCVKTQEHNCQRSTTPSHIHIVVCALLLLLGRLCTLSHSSTDQPELLLEWQEFAAHHHVTNIVPTNERTNASRDGWRNDIEQRRHSKNSKATFDTRQNNLLCSRTHTMAACLTILTPCAVAVAVPCWRPLRLAFNKI